MDEISLLRRDEPMTGTHSHLFETAIGACGIAWTTRGVAQLQLPEKDRAATERRLQKRAPEAVPSVPPPAIADAIREIQLYATGVRTDFASVPLDLEGLNVFSRTIYDLLRAVGWGQTTTYGELARRAGGGPETARAVGQAMGSNRIPVIIPCHRVLASGQKIGGFSAPGGTLTKERLLALEGVVPDAPLLPMFSEGRWA
jgi:methylated-DNA-[protein]-cysteine S-methyltransferase